VCWAQIAFVQPANLRARRCATHFRSLDDESPLYLAQTNSALKYDISDGDGAPRPAVCRLERAFVNLAMESLRILQCRHNDSKNSICQRSPLTGGEAEVILCLGLALPVRELRHTLT
jgi:hypothetical protein